MSDIRANTISDAAGTGPIELTKQATAKVWCTVNRGTNPVSFFQSFGITSVTDQGIGQYQVAFTSAFNTTRYANSGSCYTGSGHQMGVAGEAAASVYIRTFGWDGSAADVDCALISHGDLA